LGGRVLAGISQRRNIALLEAVDGPRSGDSLPAPRKRRKVFAGPPLNHDTTPRAHVASDLHHWVRLVIDEGNLDADRLREQGFPIYVTHDLAAARDSVRERFGGEPNRRSIA
jgi:hypothetical protein